MVFMIIIPMKNGYFIGNIPYFQTNPNVHSDSAAGPKEYRTDRDFSSLVKCMEWGGI